MVDVETGAPCWCTQEKLPDSLYEVQSYVVDPRDLRKPPRCMTTENRKPVLTDHPPKVHSEEAHNKVRVTVPLKQVSKEAYRRHKELTAKYAGWESGEMSLRRAADNSGANYLQTLRRNRVSNKLNRVSDKNREVFKSNNIQDYMKHAGQNQVDKSRKDYRLSRLYPQGKTRAFYEALGHEQSMSSFSREHRIRSTLDSARKGNKDEFPHGDSSERSPFYDNFSSDTRQLIGSLAGFRSGIQLLEHYRRRENTSLNWDPSHELENEVSRGAGYGWRGQFHSQEIDAGTNMREDEHREAYASYPSN
eukprot:gb/GECG01006145.1/.p1 GENE.gb/GECG01006145.1/~~gb/GECG01006145.1/.p1  ORF type:complete len:305 (+),score=33.18 gb/GECG01006145.1/:1-915(+)